MSKVNITVIGSGYVGTVTATCFAEMGHSVYCTDIEARRMDLLQQGTVPFYEEGLEPLMKTNLDEGRLGFTTDLDRAVRHGDVIFLCLGAKTLPDGRIDLSQIEKAIKALSKSVDSYKLIVEKSTLPVKSGEWLQDLLQQNLAPGVDFDIAAVPQFMREGFAVRDFMFSERVVIGAESQRAIDSLVNIYTPLNAPLLITDMNSAELIKHSTNAFLAMKISFINSIAQICEKTGADIMQVAKGLGMDSRISHSYLQAGIGYGGIFFPKDITSLVNIANEYHINLDILKTTEVVNKYQRISFIEKIEEAAGGDLHGKTVGVWGLAYRPNTDDMRDAPSAVIINGLQKRGATIKAYDPIATANAKEVLQNVTFCDSPYGAAEGVDVIAVLTSWDEFYHVNFMQLKQLTACRTIVDGRNIYSPDRMANLGFRYHCIGRQFIPPVPKAESTLKQDPPKAPVNA